MVGRLILVNVVVFIIQNVFPAFTGFLALTPRLVVEHFFVWQVVTYMFLHGGLMHILFNMLMLWLFGSTVESAWGARQFLRYYLFCGIGGAAFSLIFNYDSSVIGASGAIFGLYVAYALMFPDNYIYVYFLFPVKAKYFVTGLAVLQLANGIAGPSGIAYFAHLGGAAAGVLFFRSTLLQRARFTFGAQRRWRKHVDERRDPQEPVEPDNIDSILDKISAKGYDNLSSIEKRILENYSRKRKENND
jgi:membrane associated rhomboid family serine protease